MSVALVTVLRRTPSSRKPSWRSPSIEGYGGSLVPISSHSTSTETGVTELESPVTIPLKP